MGYDLSRYEDAAADGSDVADDADVAAVVDADVEPGSSPGQCRRPGRGRRRGRGGRQPSPRPPGRRAPSHPSLTSAPAPGHQRPARDRAPAPACSSTRVTRSQGSPTPSEDPDATYGRRARPVSLTLPLAAAACSAPERGPAGGPTPSAAATSPGATPAGSPRRRRSPRRVEGAAADREGGWQRPAGLLARPVREREGHDGIYRPAVRPAPGPGHGDDAGARAAQDKLNKALDTWSAELRRLAGTAEDFQLKTALGEMAAEVERMEATIDSVDDGRLGDIQDRLDALCPA